MPIDTARLQDTIARICQPGRGILAADESSGTIKKRFDSISIESTEEHRRSYRNMLFSAEGMEQNISGVILYDETVDQKTNTGETFPEYLESKGSVPGIKVDMGKVPHPNFAPQTMTRGLDGLEDRLTKYTERSNGALRFTKWRQVIDIGTDMPNMELLEASMDDMAQYAAICQHAGYVPITEPEVLMDGNHSIERCTEVTEQTLKVLYKMLAKHRVDPALTLLKPNMVLSGKEAKTDAPETVATATLNVFRSAVPKEVPGIVFLSGGQTPEQATANLDAIARAATEAQDPWFLSYSYGRALQEYALKAWAGKEENVPAAQAALLKRGKLNGLAQEGKYEASMEA